MAITASTQPESGWIVYVRSDFPHLIWFLSSKEGPDDIVQNQPGSDLDYLVRFWPNSSGLEASRCVQESSGPFLAEPNWPTTGFQLSVSDAFFHRRPGSYCAKPAQIQFGSGRVRFWANGYVWKQASVQESLGRRF